LAKKTSKKSTKTVKKKTVRKKPSKKTTAKKKPASKSTKKKTQKKSSARKKPAAKKSTTKKQANTTKKKTTKKKAAQKKSATKSTAGAKKKTTKKTTKKKSTSRSKSAASTSPLIRRPAPDEVADIELVYPAPPDADLYPYVLADDLNEQQLKKLKSGLSKKQVGAYFKLLLEKRAEIYGDYSAMEKARSISAGDISNMPLHMADVGSDNFDQEFTLSLIQSERRTISFIEDALQRCLQGSYGVCFKTGRPIPRARLDAKPWAKYSIEVVRELERLGRSS